MATESQTPCLKSNWVSDDARLVKLAMESAYADVVKNRFNEAMTMNAIKVGSLEFMPCLDALIVASLNGTLEGDGPDGPDGPDSPYVG